MNSPLVLVPSMPKGRELAPLESRTWDRRSVASSGEWGCWAVDLFISGSTRIGIDTARPAALALGRYSESYRLRLVGFDELPVDHPAFRHWAPAVEHAFTLKKTETYVIQEGKPGEEWLRDAYVVREYVPRADDSRQLAREAGTLPGGKRF